MVLIYFDKFYISAGLTTRTSRAGSIWSLHKLNEGPVGCLYMQKNNKASKSTVSHVHGFGPKISLNLIALEASESQDSICTVKLPKLYQ